MPWQLTRRGQRVLRPRASTVYYPRRRVGSAAQVEERAGQQRQEQYCRERGSRFMDILIVHVREELPSFYRKRGYIEDGTSPFPADVETKVPVHFIKMLKPL